jgi:hypothetical protein
VATNKLGPGTVNIGVNLPVDLRQKLEKLAARSGKKLSAYVRDILEDSVATGIVFEQVKKKSAVSRRKKEPRQPNGHSGSTPPIPPAADVG